MNMIKVNGLSYKAGKRQILKNVSLEIKKGEFVGVIGANGSGKSTLLKHIYRVYHAENDCIYIKDKDINSINTKELAKILAVVTQENHTGFDFSVYDVVSMGRYPYKNALENLNNEDKKQIENALKWVQMHEFLDKSFLNLSGGEKQRVLIARALAQQPEILILDEPTNHLDFGSQIRTLELIKKSGATILTALHDVSLAARYCDRIYVLLDGEIYKQGKPHDIVDNELISTLYGINANVFTHEGQIYLSY